MKSIGVNRAELLRKQHPTDVGFDIALPEAIELSPTKICKVDTGVRITLPDDLWAMIALRSSAGKRGLVLANGIGVIDPGYTGPLFLLLTSRWPVSLTAGERIVQLIPMPAIAVGLSDLFEKGDDRGEGGLGSTGLY